MSIAVTTKDDAEIIATIISESNKGVAQQFGLNSVNNPKHPSFCNAQWVSDDFERGEKYFLYLQGGIAVGCVAFDNPRPGVAYLNRLSVLPQYRNNGIGEQLVKHIVEYSKTKRIERISIGIIAEHTQLKQWYVKLGFERGRTTTFEHLPFDVLYMNYKILSKQ